LRLLEQLDAVDALEHGVNGIDLLRGGEVHGEGEAAEAKPAAIGPSVRS